MYNSASGFFSNIRGHNSSNLSNPLSLHDEYTKRLGFLSFAVIAVAVAVAVSVASSYCILSKSSISIPLLIICILFFNIGYSVMN